LSFVVEWNNQKVSIIATVNDVASLKIAREVEKLNLPVFFVKNNSSLLRIGSEDLPNSDIYIFLSRHSSSAGEPAFTVHSNGNFSPEEPKLGGIANTLSKTHADLQTYLLHSLAYNLPPEFKHFDVIAEATHHGPLLEKPSIFLEMGSTNEIWESEKAAKNVAKSLEFVLREKSYLKNIPTAIGFGGGHYPIKISQLMVNSDYTIGHICPKYALDFLTRDLIEQMVKNTVSNNPVLFAIFDKKGMKKKQEIRQILISLGLSIIEV
jgi:D-aminoacyl-tRNA deacylase